MSRPIEKAARQGLADAQLNLGNLYAQGQGVPRDYVKAYAWFNVAATSNETEEMVETARSRRANVAKRLNAEQLSEAQKLSWIWFAEREKN